LMDAGKRADYIGRAALERIKAQGVMRKLAGVAIEGPRIEMNAVRWAVAANGAGAGQVTSAVYSPRLNKNIGYAMMPVAHATLGMAVTVIIPGLGARKATVVSRPFVDPGKEIPKS
ncbi:MAG: glycine cleavage T C-terminal barrel domain-containing protein, partial [Burkholderiales bacterium]